MPIQEAGDVQPADRFGDGALLGFNGSPLISERQTIHFIDECSQLGIQLVERVQAALDALDPELLLLPDFEREGPRGGSAGSNASGVRNRPSAQAGGERAG